MAAPVHLNLYLAFDLLVALTLMFLAIALEIAIYGTEHGLWPVERGFFCDDRSIQFPSEGTAISWVTVMIVGFVVVIGTILLYEIGDRCFHWKPEDAESEEEEKDSSHSFAISRWILRVVSCIAIAVSAAMALVVLSDLLKLTAGRLRPSFLDVCQPEPRSYDCEKGFVSTVICTGDAMAVKDSRMSFPSKASALSMFFALYFAIYIQAVLAVETKLLRPLLQLVAVSLALFVGVWQVACYDHHPIDILAGWFLGAFAAWCTLMKIAKLFAIKIRKPRVYTLVPQSTSNASGE